MPGTRASLALLGAVLGAGLCAAAVLAAWLMRAAEVEVPRAPVRVAAPAPVPGAGLAAAAPARAALPNAGEGRVIGRCVDDAGAPIAGCLVLVRRAGAPDSETTSAADGRFVLAWDPSGRQPGELDVSSPQHLSAKRGLPAGGNGDAIDVGDLCLRRGCEVAGRVVDAAGSPVPALALRALPAGEGWDSAPAHGSAQTRADGTFTLERPLAPGRWVMRADPDEFAPAAVFTAAAGQLQLLLALAPRRVPSQISGVVVDDQGHRVAGVEVAVRNSDDVAPVKSDHDGRFRLIGWEVGDVAMLGLVPHDGEAEDAPVPVAWGSKDAQLTWRRGSVVEVVTRKAPSGAPAAGCLIAVIRLGPAAPPAIGDEIWGERSGWRTDAVGVARLRGLIPGTYVVRVSPTSDLATVEHPRVTVGGARLHRVEIGLAPAVQRALTVRFATGAPVVGARVTLGQLPPIRLSSSSAARSRRSPFLRGHQDNQMLTDAAGRCVLRGPANASSVLAIDAPQCPLLWREDVRLAAMPEPWVETVANGATIEARLEPSTLALTDQVGLRVERVDGSEVYPDLAYGRAGPTPDGLYRLAGVPAGDWRLELSDWFTRLHAADIHDLLPGETRRVAIGALGPRLAELHGTVRWNGRPTAAMSFVSLQEAPVTTGGFVGRGGAKFADDGTFRAFLAPGRYRAVIYHGMGGSGQLPIAGDIVAVAGERTELHLHLHTRPVRLRLLWRGKPLARASVRAVVDRQFELSFAATDDWGCSEFAVPLGVHELQGTATRDRSVVPLGDIEVTAGEGPQITVVNVPDAMVR